MSEFLLVFRRDYETAEIQPSKEQMHEHLKHWADWFRGLAAQDKLARAVQGYDGNGRIVKSKEVTGGPYTAENGSIGGLIILKATSYQEAARIAQDCPILFLNGTVEIRQVLDKGEQNA